MDDFFKFVDDHTRDPKTSSFIKRLGDAVGIASVSVENPPQPDVVTRMGNWLKDRLVEFGVTLKDVQNEYDPNNERPPLLVGHIGDDNARKTVLVYGHYDVQPADADGWAEQNPEAKDPFKLTLLPEDNPVKLVGRGSTDDKGPVTGWLNVLEAHKGKNLPVNIRFLFEGVEEIGGPGLDEWIAKEAKKENGFFTGVDHGCITDNYWLTTRRPTLGYATRGVVTFSVEVTGARDDLHSGIFGRMVYEPLIDLVKLLGTLVDTRGTIQVPDVEVNPPSDQELEEFRNLDYKVDDLAHDIGGHFELSQNPLELLLGKMAYPSLSFHSIDGGRQGTIIPRQVTGRFSIRLVDPQDPNKIAALVQDFLYNEFEKLGSRNLLKVESKVKVFSWLGSKVGSNFQAAAEATKRVYGENLAPDPAREGGTIPLADQLEQALNIKGTNKSKTVLLLPMGKSDDGAHSLSEKLDIENYVNGTKLYGAYLYKIAEFK